MEYAVLKQDGSFDYQIETYGDIVWGPEHTCPAKMLTAQEREMFQVVELIETLQPTFDRMLYECSRDGIENMDGKWYYKWKLKPLSQAQIDEAANTREANRVSMLWQNAYDYEFSQISGTAIVFLVLGVLQNKPKALAVKTWSQSIWTEYYVRKASGSSSMEYTAIGPCPYSVPDLIMELNL